MERKAIYQPFRFQGVLNDNPRLGDMFRLGNRVVYLLGKKEIGFTPLFSNLSSCRFCGDIRFQPSKCHPIPILRIRYAEENSAWSREPLYSFINVF